MLEVPKFPLMNSKVIFSCQINDYNTFLLGLNFFTFLGFLKCWSFFQGFEILSRKIWGLFLCYYNINFDWVSSVFSSLHFCITLVFSLAINTKLCNRNQQLIVGSFQNIIRFLSTAQDGSQLVRSLPSSHKVPSSILGSVEIWILVRPSFLFQLTQLSSW